MEHYPRFKTVAYPPSGKIQVRFRIPDDWAEDYGDESAGLLYPVPDQGEGPWPIAGMLFVSITDKQSSDGWEGPSVDKFIRSKLKANDQFHALPGGRWLVRFKSYRSEPSHRAVDHFWQLFQVVAPETLACAMFLFTAVDIYYDKPGDLYYHAVEMLEQEIAVAEIENAK
jgi:hypothetical protein